VASSFSEAKEWVAAALGRLFCGSCKSPKKFEPINAIVQRHKPKSDFEYISFVNVLSSAALDVLVPGLTDHAFALGKLQYEDGKPVAGYSSILTKKILFIRGGPYSTHRVCSECKRVLYISVGEPYLVRSSHMPSVATGQGFDILVAESLFEQQRRTFDSLKKLTIKKIPVLEAAKDKISKREAQLIEAAQLGQFWDQN